MQVKIIEQKVFTIKAGNVEIKDLKAVSEWEFFVKLQNSTGESLIVTKANPSIQIGKFESSIGSLFGEFFRNDKKDAEEGSVVGGSPSLLALLDEGK